MEMLVCLSYYFDRDCAEPRCESAARLTQEPAVPGSKKVCALSTVNRNGGLNLPRNRVVRFTDHPDMP